MAVSQSLKEDRPPADVFAQPSRWPWREIILFAIGVGLVAFLNAPSSVWTGPETGQLVDTDGYMRYLRVEELASGGDWFDSVSERSNYPFGESQHWTRPIDVYVWGLSTPLTPVAGDDALYWASVGNAPLLLIAIGIAMYAGFPMLPQSVRGLSMLVLLGLLPVTSYTSPGRVDHHGAILLTFVLAVGMILNAVRGQDRKWAWPLASVLTLGLWLSTEFLVPTALTAATLAFLAARRDDFRLAGYGARVFAGLAVGLALVLPLERGSDLMAVEYDKVSVAHLGAAVIAASVFAVLRSAMGRSRLRTWLVLGSVSAVGLAALIAVFPGFLGGPFVDVDPRVKDLWLYTVRELQPLWEAGGWATGAFLIGPIVVGLVAGSWVIRQPEPTPIWVSIVVGWLAVYAVLTVLQVRWAMFGQVLAVPLALRAIHRWYEGFDRRRLTVLVRPLVMVTLIFGLQLVAIGLDRTSASRAAPVDCRLDDVLPAMEQLPETTVLASQDVGPEILYRTHHRVIATPYHRNETGLLFVHDVMGMPIQDQGEIRVRLADREVGLILLCPATGGLLQPPDRTGTLYAGLSQGRLPDFVEPVAVPTVTDYRLFAVES